MNINNKTQKIILILAPMAGITDLPFRIICKELGANALYSEMVSATGLTYNKTKNLEYVNSCKQDSPFYVQLFGSNPKHFERAAKIIDNLPDMSETGDGPMPRRPEGLDINFGCPVKKVIKQNSGCALMRDLDLSYQIIKTVLENTSLPVSIKIRAGIEDVDALKFLDKVGSLDWKTVIVHGRTYKEGFSGPIDMELIKNIKKKLPEKTVIANGGINSPENAANILEKTKADGIAIARGCLGNPWLFKNIKEYLKTGKYSKPAKETVKKVALKHINYFLRYKGEGLFQEMRKHLGWYFKGIPRAKEARDKIYQVKNSKQAIYLVNKI